MLVVNQNDFHHIKFDVFLPQEKCLGIAKCINETIEIHSLDARLRNTEIVWLTQAQHAAQKSLKSVLVDADRTYQVLSNVVTKCVELTKRNSQVVIDSWTQVKGTNYQLFFSVTTIGQTLSEQEKFAIFEGATKGNNSSKDKSFISSLSLHISK